jgi:NAD-dependent DNA ligase
VSWIGRAKSVYYLKQAALHRYDVDVMGHIGSGRTNAKVDTAISLAQEYGLDGIGTYPDIAQQAYAYERLQGTGLKLRSTGALKDEAHARKLIERYGLWALYCEFTPTVVPEYTVGTLVEMGDAFVVVRQRTDKLLASIEKSKENEPWRLLTGLAIDNVGQTSARTIMNHFGSFEALMDAKEEDLLGVPDIGPITASSIYSFFRQEGNRALMERFAALGLTMSTNEEERSDELAGKTFVVTGDVLHFKNRAELVDFIEKKGGKCAGSVSKKTFALINNDANSLSGKNRKAKELGIPILTEEEFLAMVKEENKDAD